MVVAILHLSLPDGVTSGKLLGLPEPQFSSVQDGGHIALGLTLKTERSIFFFFLFETKAFLCHPNWMAVVQ